MKPNGKPKIPQAHSQFITGPILNYGLDIDCVIEAKQKELEQIANPIIQKVYQAGAGGAAGGAPEDDEDLDDEDSDEL